MADVTMDEARQWAECYQEGVLLLAEIAALTQRLAAAEARAAAFERDYTAVGERNAELHGEFMALAARVEARDAEVGRLKGVLGEIRRKCWSVLPDDEYVTTGEVARMADVALLTTDAGAGRADAETRVIEVARLVYRHGPTQSVIDELVEAVSALDAARGAAEEE